MGGNLLVEFDSCTMGRNAAIFDSMSSGVDDARCILLQNGRQFQYDLSDRLLTRTRNCVHPQRDRRGDSAQRATGKGAKHAHASSP
jgi:hypothetical protein